MTSPERNSIARRAAEQALVRIVHLYGTTPEFVLIGGLVPELLCAGSGFLHAGTTDVDVQVNLEVAAGGANAMRLERALVNAEFVPSSDGIWRWRAADSSTEIRFELLADLDDAPSETVVRFDTASALGAVNLRGTGYAVLDPELTELQATVGGVRLVVNVRVASLGGFLLAKICAARSRREPKDWYDVAFVLRHNAAGGVDGAIAAVRDSVTRHGQALPTTALVELRANFADEGAQGVRAFVDQYLLDHAGSPISQTPSSRRRSSKSITSARRSSDREPNGHRRATCFAQNHLEAEVPQRAIAPCRGHVPG